MTRAGWFAIGAAVAALAARALPDATAPAAVATGVVATLTALLVVGARRDQARPALASLVGATLVLVRLAIAPVGVELVPVPPTGSGTWTAVVESVSAPQGSRHSAILVLDDSPTDVRVAASLPRYPEIEPGQRVEVAGSLEPVPDDAYGSWLRRIGAAATLRGRSITVVGGSDPTGVVERFRRASGRAIDRLVPEPGAGLAAGILIGLRDRVDRTVASDFTTAGVSHIVAISGWNIAIVAAAISVLLPARRRRSRSLAILLAIGAYTLFAGASPSVVRAALMAGVVLLARLGGRAGRAAAALGVAAALLLLIDPAMIADAGFQLSVAATAGLLAWATPLRSRLDRLGRGHAPSWLTETLALSLAAQAATLPIVLATFGRLSLVAPLANIVVAPLVPITMATGALAMAAGWAVAAGLPAPVGVLLAMPASISVGILIAIVHLAASVPLASVVLPPLVATGAGLLAALVVMAFVLHRRLGARSRPGRSTPGRSGVPPHGADGPARAGPSTRARPSRRRGPGRWVATRSARLLAAALAGSLLLFGTAAAARPDGRVRVSILDVGQGDAILVQGGGTGRMLVDTGPDPERLLVALDARIPPWDRRLDVVVITHPHEDHVGGLPALLDRYRIGRVLVPGMRGPGPADAAARARMHELGIEPEVVTTGDRLALDDIEFRVLWPDAGSVPDEPADTGRGINDVSVVLLGEIGPARFLLTGDAEDDVDPTLVDRGLPTVDLLKVAHHGSRTATSAALIDALRPAVAVISVGADNPYGHPSPATVERLREAGARVLRTDQVGTVTAAFDGSSWSITTERPPRDAAETPAQAGTTAAAVRLTAARSTLGYHPSDDRADPHRGGRDPAPARSARLVPPPLLRRGRDRRLPRARGRRPRASGGSITRRGGGTAARRRQARRGAGRAPPATRRRLGRLAHCGRSPGARPGRGRPPGHPARG